MPIRWVDDVRLAPDDGAERIAGANYYRDARPAHGHPGHPGRPGRRSPGSSTPTSASTSASTRAPATVAESTLALLATFPPNDRLPAGAGPADLAGDHGRAAARRVRLSAPGPVLRALVRGGLKARGRVVRFLPPRPRPFFARQLPQIRSYPDGYDGRPSSARSRPAAPCRTAGRQPTTSAMTALTRKGGGSRPVSGLGSAFRQRRRVRCGGGRHGRMRVPGPRLARPASGIAAPALSGGMCSHCAMNRRARGLRGLDVLRRSQDRAPPQFS